MKDRIYFSLINKLGLVNKSYNQVIIIGKTSYIKKNTINMPIKRIS